MENLSKATLFEFVAYEFKPEIKQVVFHYATKFKDREAILFTETIILPSVPNLENIPAELIKKMLESLHLILGISYYKFYCASEVKTPYLQTKKESDFWSAIYKKGLGEFFYKNNLNPNISPKFPYNSKLLTTNYSLPTNSSKCLVGIGGGKDSIVVAELLKENGFDFESFFIKTNQDSKLTEKIIQTISVNGLKIERLLDSKVHQRHDFNGHIPISAIYAFLGVFLATLFNFKYVIVGNEQSSNFGNVKYRGLDVNHQWSKSFEFEKMFQDYVAEFLTPDIFYFSLLRSFYEIRIVKLFTKYPKYFPYFSSCNKNFSINNKSENLWCGQCAKCVFVFTLLSAFLSKNDLLAMFGKNLYQDEQLLPVFKDILGLGSLKPFDCVGTFAESQTAMFLAKNKYKNDFIVRQIGRKIKYHPEVFFTNKENSIPQQFKFLGMDNVYVLGYGKEGKASKQFIKKYYPKLKVVIGDEALDKNYLKKQTDFDIAIKTPGINKENVSIPYTTATNIFLAKVKGKNLTIGVTGSKGKSTTASLIYHILKTAGKDVVLVGNIGTPMLGELLQSIPENRIFVLELSSYQLDDVKISPDIALVTNLFPEHLDYHGSLKNYYQAKKNIINFQTASDYFVYNEKTTSWLKKYSGQSVNFSTQKYQSNLIGPHNQSNIGGAVAVANILKIEEEAISEAIKSFKGLTHRLEFVGEFRGIKFYDDAISTTPHSTIMAIKSLPNIGTIFLGGTDRGYDFIQLEKALKQYKIKNVVLFPDSGKRIIKNEKDFNILKTQSMKEAVEFAYQNTLKDKICLLSCASPSYSLWKNFEVKGDEFKKFVRIIGKK